MPKMYDTDFPIPERDGDWLLGQAVQILIEESHEDEASLLIACRLECSPSHPLDENNLVYPTLHGPVSVIREFEKASGHRWDDGNLVIQGFDAIKDAFRLVFAPELVGQWSFRVERTELPANWRKELLDTLRKMGTTNQGLGKTQGNARPIMEYAGLRFRSATEIKIAKTLDQKGVLYFANCTARLNAPGDRLNREPDFLICHEGKWGILEVDGDPFHPPSRASAEHERDELFKKHGIICIERYNANRCYEEPLQVVVEFLDLLSKS